MVLYLLLGAAVDILFTRFPKKQAPPENVAGLEKREVIRYGAK